LLLGWDETPKPAEPPRPSALTLAHSLTPALELAVLLPHLPEEETTIPQAHITGLGNLDPHKLAATARPAGAWQAPAAPYAGAENPPQWAAAAAEPDTTPVGSVTVVAAAPALPKPAPAPAASHPATPDYTLDSEPGNEPGPAEASALSQAEDNLTLTNADLDSAIPAAEEPQSPLQQALAALRTESPADADLNFRIIQYARFAAPQARGQDFAVIYATDWPVWLAALEIRQLTGRPLVLHVHSLAIDRNTPADRGWALELERLTLRRADLVLAASPAVAERLRAVYNFSADRCRVVDPNDSHALHEVLNSFTPAA